jgi:hypothetical protein
MLASAAPAGAQTMDFKSDRSANPSHIEVPFHPPAGGQLADFLRSRDHARQAAETSEPLRQFLDKLKSEGHEDLLKELFKEGQPRRMEELNRQEMLNLLERLQRLLNQKQEFGNSPAPLLQSLESLKKYVEKAPQGASIKPFEPPTPTPTQKPPVSTPDGASSQSKMPERGIPPAPPQPMTLEEKSEALGKGISDWLKTGPLGNSETLRELGRKLSQPIIGSDKRDANADGLLERLSRLGNYAPLKDFFSRRMPSMPKPSLANAPTGFRSPEAPDGRVIKILLWVGMAALVIVLVWQAAAGRRATGVAAGQPAWRLGPWPVDPSQVATRQDLVRAFEYLALLVLGSAARTWNHRAIARRLSDQPNAAAEERRRAALHLAALYEKARYAPPSDTLPENEVQDARRNLCLLAGVACA